MWRFCLRVFNLQLGTENLQLVFQRIASLRNLILKQVQNDGLCRFHGRSQQLRTDNLQPVYKAKKLTGSNINAIVRSPERPRRSWKILPMPEVTSAFGSASSKLCSWPDLAGLTPSATTWLSPLKGGFKMGIIRSKKQTHARNS